MVTLKKSERRKKDVKFSRYWKQRAAAAGCVYLLRDVEWWVQHNPALAAGVRAGAVVAVFVWAPEEEGHYYPGRVSRWWLKHSLAHLDFSLRSLGTSLVIKRSTDTVSTLLGVVKSTGATQLFFNHLYGDISKCPAETLMFEDELEKGSNALLARAWSPGWSNADKALTTFLNGPLIDYSKNRRKADSTTTSYLSPHLHFGEVSVRKVFHLVCSRQALWANEGNKAGENSVNLFLKSIGLREYSRYLSFNHPYSHERPLLGPLKFFPWVVDDGYFKAWRQGRTGYPLVDTGMRELWASGWLHDRIRVVVSSFFVKVLQLPWRWGMKYFWDTLLDADLESDTLGWQYISGTLPDGHEINHIDYPQFEGDKFDHNREYVRRWLPELARLPTEWIHHPWSAPDSVLKAAGVELGSNYPLPIVGIDAAKVRLQNELSEMWQQEAASRAAVENRTEEGLVDSSESPPIAVLQDIQVEERQEPVRDNPPATIRRCEDQMVPSMTSCLERVEEEETSLDVQNVRDDSRAELPRNIYVNQEPRRETLNEDATRNVHINNSFSHLNFIRGLVDAEDPGESSSSSRRERDGSVVPVWSPPSFSYHEQYSVDENRIGTSSYLQRHPQSHQTINWRQLSQTG